MADKVLYFPYMTVPQNDWFNRVLLYWDEVGSIVPSDYVSHPESLGTHMQELKDAELLKLVSPAEHIHKIPNFTESFLELLEQNDVVAARGTAALEGQDTLRIHIEKFSPIAYDMMEMGLARPAEEPWYEVEQLTANLFMFYLSSVLGGLEELKMDPITDNAEFLAMHYTSSEAARRPIDIFRDLDMSVIKDILPAPAAEIPVNELVEFKERYSDSLGRFRRHIQSQLIDITAAIPDTQLRDERVRIFDEDVREQKSEILARMRERRWRIVLGDVAAIAVSAARWDVPSAVAALVRAVESAFSRDRARQREIKSSPLAYAALAQETFGPRPTRERRRSWFPWPG